MSAHFRWYSASEETVVPWNARYEFPSQANKCVKTTPRITPKNGAQFNPGQVIRLEFPAQSYINPINTTLEFDVELLTPFTTLTPVGCFQNNIQSIFNRVRLLYGSTPLEDMIQYNQIVRNLTEWTATNQTGTIDQTSIAEGIGGVQTAYLQNTTGTVNAGGLGLVNVRQAFIQGYNYAQNSTAGIVSKGLGVVPNQASPSANTSSIRRYQVNLALGLLTQDKLIPAKFMASQLAIEITLEQAAACIIAQPGTGGVGVNVPTYQVSNVNLIPEQLDFDSSYDAGFLMGLQDSGVPIKFSSW